MKAHYDPQSDILYLRLNPAEIEESNELADGIVADYDKKGNIVALEFWDATERCDDPRLLEHRVLTNERVPA